MINRPLILTISQIFVYRDLVHFPCSLNLQMGIFLISLKSRREANREDFGGFKGFGVSTPPACVEGCFPS